MAKPINFAGSNVIMHAPAGAENVQDMHVFRTRHSCVSCWEVPADELAEINATGRIFLSVLAGGQQPPVYVGSESACRNVLIDFGAVWPMTSRPRAQLPEDVVALVIAAREFWQANEDMSEESRALDKALEAFAGCVPYENEPDGDLEYICDACASPGYGPDAKCSCTSIKSNGGQP